MIENDIKILLLASGADLCGIAHIDRFRDAPEGFHPRDIYKECRSVVVFAKELPRGLSLVSPKIAYNRFNDQSVQELDRIALAASLSLERLFGATAVPLPADPPYDHWIPETKEGRGIISMKHAAALAGLGSMGRNTILTNRDLGSRINLGAILTNLELRSDPEAEHLCTDGCSICIDSCPAEAISDRGVDQKRCRENTFAANARGFSIVYCNTCRVICPHAMGGRAS